MNLVFISNISVPQANVNDHNFGDCISTTEKSFSVEKLDVDPSGDSIFLINVHCIFKYNDRQIRLQEQGGIIIYRHLLKIFGDAQKQDKLKVVFYSPIAVDVLIRRKPENYILKFLPFVQLKFVRDEQFTEELSTVLNDLKTKRKSLIDGQDFSSGWLQFNNASENLLSGWALNGNKKIEANNKKLLFIDDQQSEWKSTFNCVFDHTSIIYIKNAKYEDIASQNAYRNKMNANWHSFIELVKSQVDNKPDLILSDFYLKENHEVNKWKDIDEIKSKSGYQLFEVLRSYTPATPYIFHTTSNKAATYKFFDAQGVDDWIIKDVRVDASNDEKKENFQEFQKCLENYFVSTIYQNMSEIYQCIVEMDTYVKHKNGNDKFWINNYYNNKDEINDILISCWLAIRRLLNREIYFENNLLAKLDFYSDTYTTSSICTNLGKILQLLKFRNDYAPRVCCFLHELRNISSHIDDIKLFHLTDGIIYFKFLFHSVKNNTNINRGYNKYFHKKSSNENYKFSIFWIYVHLYNHIPKTILVHEKKMVQSRIEILFTNIKDDYDFRMLLSQTFKSLTDADATRVSLDAKDKIILSFENDICHIKVNPAN